MFETIQGQRKSLKWSLSKISVRPGHAIALESQPRFHTKRIFVNFLLKKINWHLGFFTGPNKGSGSSLWRQTTPKIYNC